MQLRISVAIYLDFQHSASNNISIGVQDTSAPGASPQIVQAIIEEARKRARRRHLLILAAACLALAVGLLYGGDPGGAAPRGIAGGEESKASSLSSAGPFVSTGPVPASEAHIAAALGKGSTSSRQDWQAEIDEIEAAGHEWAQVSEAASSGEQVAHCREELNEHPNGPCLNVIAHANGDLEAGIYEQGELDQILRDQGYLEGS